MTGSDLSYNDLISTEDQEFWNYLCKKDFRRLEKLLTQEMGKGIFMDDTDSDDQDNDNVWDDPNGKTEIIEEIESPTTVEPESPLSNVDV